MSIDLTLVIPVLNEVANLRPLVKEIAEALDGRNIAYEVLFIDDGSSDGSFELIKELHARRITSYNVCYTKLLRAIRSRLRRFPGPDTPAGSASLSYPAR